MSATEPAITFREMLDYTDYLAQWTTASNRKILAQVVLHSVHHWAQVAMEVRQAGLPTQPPQDIIISPVMD